MFKLIISLLIVSSLVFSIGVITSKNPVVSVVYLICLFIFGAIILILSGIQFIGVAYILVYVGAVAILFLFVIMMINIKLSDILETGKEYTKSIPLAICIGGLFTISFYSLLNINTSIFSTPYLALNGANELNIWIIDITPNILNQLHTFNNSVLITLNPNIPDTAFVDVNQIESIGNNIYTYGAINLIITSFILLIAMIAALYLSKDNHNLPIDR